MINISGFGLEARITASNTFPNGFLVTEWADDADPLDTGDVDLADTGMGLNGDLVVWARPQGIEVTLSVIPKSDSDLNLAVLADANRIAKDKPISRDVIGIVFTYPDGQVVTMSKGIIVSAPMLSQVASAGRLKTKTYKFRFEQITKAG